jgi:hypothetical protein
VLTRIITNGQEGAARNAEKFVPAVLAEHPGPERQPVGKINAPAYSGWASDGRPLGSLLVWSVTHAQDAKSLDAGREFLDMVVQTQLADVARQATQVGAYTRDVGYVRITFAPCCQRCAVLAGKFSHYSEAFRRHPRCQCQNTTAKGASSVSGVVIGPDDVHDLTIAQRKAISDGADMNQVINSHKAGARHKMTTTEGTTRRGTAGRRLGARSGRRAARLTPEGIYRIASDRAEALKLLRQHGYIF